MATPSNATVRTVQIGAALAALIKAGALGSDLKLCRFGNVERALDLGPLEEILPACIVVPSLVVYTGRELSGRNYEPVDNFRITYLFDITDTATDVPTRYSQDMQSILESLATDLTLTSANGFTPPQGVISSMPQSLEWFPPEDATLKAAGLPIKAVVLAWAVRWMAR